MKKVSKPYKVKDRKGYYVRWFECGRRRHKQLNTLAEAEMFRSRQYMLLNNDVYSSVSIGWDEAVKEYLTSYDVRNLAASSKEIAERSLAAFRAFSLVSQTRHISQKVIDGWAIKMLKEQSPFTVNKNLGRLRAFLNWLKDRGYQVPPCRITTVKQRANAFVCPSNKQIRELLKRCPSLAWKASILIYLTTGLRREDLRIVSRDMIFLDRKLIAGVAQKTGKVFNQPLPDLIIPILKKYLKSNKEQMPFVIKNARKEFDSFRGDFTFQIFRKTHSTLMQTIGNISIAQQMLQHSDSRTTQEFYTDADLVTRWKINQLPIDQWLKK